MVGICVQEKEMEKQKLLYQQARLHDRGAAEMVLQTISASKGEGRRSPRTSLLHGSTLLYVLLIELVLNFLFITRSGDFGNTGSH